MANIKVTELNEAASIKDEDIIMVVQDGVNKKIPKRLLNEVIISPTEPTTNERVWLKKGKNMFNKNAFSSYVWFNSDGSTYSTNDNHIISEYIEVKPNTQYTFMLNVDAFISIRGYDKNKNQTETYIDSTAQTITFRTNENTFFVKVGIGNGLNYINNSIQLEPGEVATSCEEYIEPTILVKNSNGVFEEFIKKQNRFVKLSGQVVFDSASSLDTELQVALSGNVKDYDLLLIQAEPDFEGGTGILFTNTPNGSNVVIKIGIQPEGGSYNAIMRAWLYNNDTNILRVKLIEKGNDRAFDALGVKAVYGVKF